MIGRLVSAPRASAGVPAGAWLLGTEVALGCGAAVGAGWLVLAVVGASVGAGALDGCSVGWACVGAAGAAVVGTEAPGWPPQAASAIRPPSSGTSRRNGFGKSIVAPLWMR